MSSRNANWEQRGQQAVGAAADLATGLFKGFRSLGGRIQTARFQHVVEAFCAYSGLVAAQNGRLRQTEIDGFRRFLIDNRQHPVLGHFTPDELVDKFRDYAIKAFLEEQDAFVSVLDKIEKQSEEANLIVAGCLTVVFADGFCDPLEREQIDLLAANLQVDLNQLAHALGVSLPPSDVNRPAMPGAPATATRQTIAQPAPAAPVHHSPFSRAVGTTAPTTPPQGMAPSLSQPPPVHQAGPWGNAAPVQQPPAPPPVTPQTPPPTPSPAPPSGQRAPCSFCNGKGCAFCGNTGFSG